MGNQKGMTLLEIMIVFILIAGLITLVSGKVMNNFQKAKVRQTAAQFGQIKSSLESYNADCNEYPPTEVGLNGLLSSEGTNCQTWGPEAYIDKSLLKDPWGTPVIYENLGGNFVLKSLGKDKKEGGDGFDKDITNEEQ